MFQIQFKFLFLLYELYGFQPGFFKNRMLVNGLFLLRGMVLTYITIGFFKKKFVEKVRRTNSGGKRSRNSNYMLYTIAYDYIIRFWLIVKNCKKNRKGKKEFKIRNHIIQSIVFFSVSNSFLLMTSFEYFDDEYLTVLDIIIINLCQNYISFYVLHLEVIHFELKIIENELNECRNSSDMERCIKLIKIQESYCLVHEMVENVNIVFGWSYMATILFCFHYLLTEINYVFPNPNHFNFEDNEIVFSFICKIM